MMKKCIRQELLYGLKSKTYYGMTALLILLYGIILFMNYDAAKSSYNYYLRYIDYYEKNNFDAEKDLNSGEYAVQKKGKATTITNPLLYYKNDVGRYLYSASPKYLITQLLESSILYFPVVFGILGLIISNYDLKYKTIKVRTIRTDKNTYSIAKQFSLFCSCIAIIICSLVCAFLIGCIVYKKLCNIIPTGQFNFEYTGINATLMSKFVFSGFIAIIFAEWGYALGSIFKNITFGMAFIVIYMFIVPNMGKYDLKNSLYFILHKIFDFLGVISVQTSKNTTPVLSAFIIALVAILPILLNIMIVNKRSTYNC